MDRAEIPSTPEPASPPDVAGTTPPGKSTLPPAVDRDRLYRANAAARNDQRSLAGIDPRSASVALLGLETITISRLYHLGCTTLADLYEASVDDLWRRLGRHCMGDIVGSLQRRGLAVPALTNFQLWRLGLLDKNAATTEVRADTRVQDLWPRIPPALADALRQREIHSVRDIAPVSVEDVRQLYRLGRSNLRVLRDILAEVIEAEEDTGALAATLRHGVRLIEDHLTRSGEDQARRTRGTGTAARPAPSDAHRELPSPGRQ